VFSLHATKVLGVGEGGLVAGGDPGFIQTVRMLSNNGYSRWMCRRVGGNMKLSEYHAAVGLAQLERLPGVRERVEKVGRAYATGLALLTGRIRTQPAPATLLRSVMCVKLETAHAEPVAGALAQAGIETRRWYCPPLFEHPAFSEFARLGPDGGPHLPVTADLGQRLLGLPFHTSLQPDDILRICTVLAATLQDLESA
jgi:dTDP-4-amino-4,6-dideoxygalactose transaminase